MLRRQHCRSKAGMTVNARAALTVCWVWHPPVFRWWQCVNERLVESDLLTQQVSSMKFMYIALFWSTLRSYRRAAAGMQALHVEVVGSHTAYLTVAVPVRAAGVHRWIRAHVRRHHVPANERLTHQAAAGQRLVSSLRLCGASVAVVAQPVSGAADALLAALSPITLRSTLRNMLPSGGGVPRTLLAPQPRVQQGGAAEIGWQVSGGVQAGGCTAGNPLGPIV